MSSLFEAFCAIRALN